MPGPTRMPRSRRSRRPPRLKAVAAALWGRPLKVELAKFCKTQFRYLTQAHPYGTNRAYPTAKDQSCASIRMQPKPPVAGLGLLRVGEYLARPVLPLRGHLSGDALTVGPDPRVPVNHRCILHLYPVSFGPLIWCRVWVIRFLHLEERHLRRDAGDSAPPDDSETRAEQRSGRRFGYWVCTAGGVG
jgi:hypothetical protein